MYFEETLYSWKKHKLESRLLGEISITSDDTTLMAESEEELKSLLMKVKEETWPASRETCMQVRKQQLELDIEQQTGSK